MGYCVVSLQLLVILEKCWLEGGGFAFDNWHLLLETDKGVNFLSLGKVMFVKKHRPSSCLSLKDELIFSLDTVWSCRQWHNTPGLLLPKVRRAQRKDCFGNRPPIARTNLLRDLECFGLVSEAMLCFTLLSQYWANELMGFVPRGKGMFFPKPCKVLEVNWNWCWTSWCPSEWPLASTDLKRVK